MRYVTVLAYDENRLRRRFPELAGDNPISRRIGGAVSRIKIGFRTRLVRVLLAADSIDAEISARVAGLADDERLRYCAIRRAIAEARSPDLLAEWVLDRYAGIGMEMR